MDTDWSAYEVHSPGTPAEGRWVVVPRRQLDHLRVPDNEGVLLGASSLQSFCVLQSHHASIPHHKMKFCGIVVWVRWQQIEQCI